MNIEIRKANSHDAIEISKISHDLVIQDYQDHASGFLYCPKSPEQYQKCMDQTNHFFVAEDTDTNTIAGWLIGETMNELKGMHNYMHTQEAAIYAWLLEQHNDIFYIDQIAINTRYQRKSIGTHLLQAVMKSAPNKQYIAAISLKPAYNAQSVNFFSRKHGWKKIHELWDNIPGHPKTLCGIFASKHPHLISKR